MSGTMILSSGRKIRSVARPSGPSSFGGRPTTIDWSSGRLPHRHAVDRQRRERLLRRVEAGVVAERPLGQHLARLQPALQHDLAPAPAPAAARSGSRPSRPACPARNPANRYSSMSPGSGAVDGVRHGGRAAEGDRDRQPLAPPRRHLVVVAAVLVDLPVHADGALVVALEAVQPEVALAGLRVLGVGQPEVEEEAAVLGPGEQRRAAGRGRPRRPCSTTSWHGALSASPSSAVRASSRRACRRPRGRPTNPCGSSGLSSPPILLADLVVRLQAERLSSRRSVPNTFIASGIAEPAHVLEEQRGAARLLHPVDDLPDLQIRVHLGLDALEVALALQRPEQGAKIVVSHAVQYPRPATLAL